LERQIVTLHPDEYEAARALMGMCEEDAEMGGVGMETGSVDSGDTEVVVWEDGEGLNGA
jgi:hypothetical protein